MDEVLKNLDILFDSPQMLGRLTPEAWYRLLCEYGYDVKPLGRGNFKNVPFKNGGGFRVLWGGDRIFQYHPPGRTHHGKDAYYKLKRGGNPDKAKSNHYSITGFLHVAKE